MTDYVIQVILTAALVGIVVIVNYKLNKIIRLLEASFQESNEDARRIKIRQAFARNRERKLIQAK